jgi:hypothetical protein
MILIAAPEVVAGSAVGPVRGVAGVEAIVTLSDLDVTECPAML